MYGYYDGIPEDIKKLSLDELEEEIKKEQQKCNEPNKSQKRYTKTSASFNLWNKKRKKYDV